MRVDRGTSHIIIAAVILGISFPMRAGAKNAAPGITFNPVNNYSWFQFGRTIQSSDSTDNNWSHNTIGAAVAILEERVDIGDRMSAVAGLGIAWYYPMMGRVDPGNAGQMYKGMYPFPSSLYMNYRFGDLENPPFQVTAGLFGQRTDPYTQNLGEYLLRGPVYPGYLFGGFNKLIEISPTALKLSSSLLDGELNQDLLFIAETELKPFYDISIAYLCGYKFLKLFDVGIGVNFYHLISTNEDITTPGNEVPSPTYVYFDTVSASQVDTIVYSHRGTKLMARLAIDFKPLFKTEIFGPNDLILYSEAAILGVKNYRGYYDTLTQRIPVMVGINIPTFKLLDVLSIELEYYEFPYRNDYRNIENTVSPIPVSNQNYMAAGYDPHHDDFKWSIYASRFFADHFELALQFADDHYRSGGTGFWGKYYEIFTEPDDWYWMARAGFYF